MGKGRPGDTDKAGVQSGGNKHQTEAISGEQPGPTPGLMVYLETADSTLPREMWSGSMMDDSEPVATIGESASVGLRPASQLPVKLFTVSTSVLPHSPTEALVSRRPSGPARF